MISNKDFQEVVDVCLIEEEYVGLGNPDAKILLIGKESALEEVDIEDTTEKALLYKIYKENALQWNTNTYSTHEDVPNIDVVSKTNYSPLFPHKGDINAIGPTWKNYQKLIDYIRGNNSTSKSIDFLISAFTTEINGKLALYSEKNTLEKRNQIAKRMQVVFCERQFWQNFPIVIVAAGHYPKENHFDMEQLFKVKWDCETHQLSTGNFYNVHRSLDGFPAKLLIHTRQFSNGISNTLIEEIGEVCKEFCEINNFIIK